MHSERTSESSQKKKKEREREQVSAMNTGEITNVLFDFILSTY